MPAVNQIELHPYFLNDEVREYGEAHGIATEAWSPIAQGAVLDDPVITAIADRLGRTPAQVVLRWHLERGNIVFPKSTTPARIRENFGVFDFALEPGDLDAIDALDRGEAGRIGAAPGRLRLRPRLNSMATHCLASARARISSARAAATSPRASAGW